MTVGQGRKMSQAISFNGTGACCRDGRCARGLNCSGVPRRGEATVPLTPKNLGTKTTKRVSNIPHIQVALCGFLENCMF